MTQDEIIAMAKEAGMRANPGHDTADGKHWPAVAALSSSVPMEWLERFAALVAANEREACAQALENLVADHVAGTRKSKNKLNWCDAEDRSCEYVDAWSEGAAAIRARTTP